jgi:acetyl-CoA synthetase
MPRQRPLDSTGDGHAALVRDFHWQVPARFNIATACSARWARSQSDAVAIRYERVDGSVTDYRYGQLQRDANRLSNALRRLGVQRGDRVAVVMPQRFETAVANIAVYQLGAVAMPLSMLFGPDALQFRLEHSEARVAIVDGSAIDNLLVARQACPALRHLIAVDAAAGRGDIDWNAALHAEADRFDCVDTHSDDAAVLIYTSGTTGAPKGALVPHRALIGNLSGFVASQNWFGFDPTEETSMTIRPSPSRERERERVGVSSRPRPRTGKQSTRSVFWPRRLGLGPGFTPTLSRSLSLEGEGLIDIDVSSMGSKPNQFWLATKPLRLPISARCGTSAPFGGPVVPLV